MTPLDSFGAGIAALSVTVLMVAIIPVLFQAFVTAYVAEARGRSYIGWFVISFLLPGMGILFVIGLPVIAAPPPTEAVPDEESQDIDTAGFATCPNCRYGINPSQSTCENCGEPLK